MLVVGEGVSTLCDSPLLVNLLGELDEALGARGEVGLLHLRALGSTRLGWSRTTGGPLGQPGQVPRMRSEVGLPRFLVGGIQCGRRASAPLEWSTSQFNLTGGLIH